MYYIDSEKGKNAVHRWSSVNTAASYIHTASYDIIPHSVYPGKPSVLHYSIVILNCIVNTTITSTLAELTSIIHSV